MGRGRKPQPTALKIAKGTRADRINVNEPKPDRATPRAPAYLKGEALREWKRVIPLLAAMDVLSKIDGTAIAIYCLGIGRLVKAQLALDKEDLTAQTDRGGTRTNPLAKIVREESALALRYMAEFGATPVARTRLVVTTGANGDDLDAFLKGNG